MRIKSLEFSLRELAGSMGDFGTLLPLAVGYIAVNGLNPAGFLVMMGLANIVTGLVYGLPMPIEPMKVIAAVTIAQHWSPSLVYASGFAMGAIWLIFAATNLVGWLAKVTPRSVIWGIQITLGILLAVEAVKLIAGAWVLGIVSIGIVLLLRQNRYAPAAVVLILLGVAISIVNGTFHQVSPPSFTLPPLTGFSLKEVWQSLIDAGFAQIPLTVTNATIATAALIKTYWPEKAVSERRLSLNQGIMNAIVPFFGGMPMCHGAGGLAGQYYFGARTGSPWTIAIPGRTAFTILLHSQEQQTLRFDFVPVFMLATVCSRNVRMAPGCAKENSLAFCFKLLDPAVKKARCRAKQLRMNDLTQSTASIRRNFRRVFTAGIRKYCHCCQLLWSFPDLPYLALKRKPEREW